MRHSDPGRKFERHRQRPRSVPFVANKKQRARYGFGTQHYATVNLNDEGPR